MVFELKHFLFFYHCFLRPLSRLALSFPPPPFARPLSYLTLATACEYEKAHERDRSDLQCFFDNSLPYLRHPEVRHWGDTLALARERGSNGSESDIDGRGGGGAARA